MSDGDNISDRAIDEGEGRLFATTVSLSETPEDRNEEGLSVRKKLTVSCRIGLA
jgi:hypothetical protein